MSFPQTLNKEHWETFLGRELTTKELFIIDSYRMERVFNDKITNLYNISREKRLYNPLLTDLYGNCLFESLKYYSLPNSYTNTEINRDNLFKICDDEDKLRKGLAEIMFMFRDYKNFFPNQEDSLMDIFAMGNDIDTVLCKDDGLVYKYTYDIMCDDLASDFSWTRLPTQLILMVLSKLLNIKIIIISDTSEYQHEINMCEVDCDNNRTIYLGHIGESHYIPLDVRKGEPNEDICMKYNDSKIKFYRWARTMAKIKNMTQLQCGDNEYYNSEIKFDESMNECMNECMNGNTNQ